MLWKMTTGLIPLRLPLEDNKYTTIVSTYASTMTNPEKVKDKFYNDLDVANPAASCKSSLTSILQKLIHAIYRDFLL